MRHLRFLHTACSTFLTPPKWGARHVCVIAGGLISTTLSSNGFAAPDQTPFTVSNQNPLVALYGLPQAQSGEIQKPNTWRTGISYQIINTSTDSSIGGELPESIELDGETQRAALNLSYGLTPRVDLTINIPTVRHSGGHTDGFIDDWHSFFGLPDGNRNELEENQLRYRYERNGEVLLDFSEDQSGTGDISLSLGFALQQDHHSGTSLRLGVKSSTGDIERLTGSDSVDTALSLHYYNRAISQHLGFEASIGGVVFGDAELLEDIREDHAFFGSNTLYWQLNPSVQLKLQLDWHTALYDSELEEIGDNSAQLVLGGAINLNRDTQLEIFVTEDIAVNTAPDVVFGLALKARTP